jgi:ribosomal protein S4
MGLVAVNGKVVYDRDYRLQPGDVIRLNPQKIENFRAFFTPAKRK